MKFSGVQVALLFASVFMVVGLTVYACPKSFEVRSLMCVDGKKFCKEFVGYVDSVVGNVLIKDASGKVWFNGPLPVTHKICIENIPHGTVLLIEWKDWRGVMQERFTVLCEDNLAYLKNDIPYPKSTH